MGRSVQQPFKFKLPCEPSRNCSRRFLNSEIQLLANASSDSIKNIGKETELRIYSAINLFLKEKVSLAKAAELAGITTIEFKEILAAKGIIRGTEGKSVKEIDEKLIKLG